ncbi:MAG: alpha/beta hydrolase, partial [Comamonadaceae bacterium]
MAWSRSAPLGGCEVPWHQSRHLAGHRPGWRRCAAHLGSGTRPTGQRRSGAEPAFSLTKSFIPNEGNDLVSPSTLNTSNTNNDDQGKPNPVVNALSNAVAALRADDDQLELAKAHEGLGPKAIEKLDVAEARRQPTAADAVAALLRQQGRTTAPEDLVPDVRASSTTVTGAVGSLPATVYTPTGTGPFPVILYFHGGGWVIANKEVYDGGARGLAHASGAIVVSVDYRQAPEHRFPAAWDDALAAYK